MRLDDEQESLNVEDRRAQRGGFGGFVGGGNIGRLLFLWPLIRPLLRTKIGWIIIIIGAFFYFGNPLALFSEKSSHKVATNDDANAVFIKKVLRTTERVWDNLLPKYGYRYTKPTLVLYRGHTSSGCGYASAQMGPFYCPMDQKIYLDLNFFDELTHNLNAGGDFARAYVLAHEVGHHVQNILGILSKIHRLQQQALQMGDKTKANHLQIPVELQADCLAGVWAHFVQSRLEPGDIKEAINAASQIGDDVLQKRSQGYVVPDSFTHGTARERVYWFEVGFRKGDLRACNTFK